MSDATDAVIVAAVRTPIGRSGRSLAGLSLQDIGMQTVAGAIAAAGLQTDDIDDLILGEVLQGGGCTARYVANALGLPPDTPGGTVQRQCATGMMAVQEAAANIRSGMAEAVIAGGVESMTRSPLMFERSPFPFGGVERFIPPSHPDSPEAPNMNMLITVGENTARECGITREESDHWSYHSNIRAVAATDDGRFAEEIVPGDGAGRPGRDGDGERRRAPAAGHHAGEAGRAAVVDRAGRADHGRELVGHRGRRRGPGGGRPHVRRGARDGAVGDGAVVELLLASSRPARGWHRPFACPGP